VYLSTTGWFGSAATFRVVAVDRSAVARDRSLEEFATEASNGNNDAGGGSETQEPDESSGNDPPDAERGESPEVPGIAGADDRQRRGDTEPIASIYRWSPDGAPCASCGEHVRARWRSDDALVCVDCKEW